MVCIAEHDEIWVIAVVIFDQDAFVLQTNDSDSVLEVLEERGKGYSVCRARAMRLIGSWSLAPSKTLYRP